MINRVTLIGNTGNDPEVRSLTSSTDKMATFSLATSESYTNRQGEKIVDTEWFNIVVYGNLAEIVEKYVTKGKQLYIEGKFKTDKWEDKEGNKRETIQVVLNNFNGKLQLLGKKEENAF